MNNISLGQWAGYGNVENNDDLCVYTTHSTSTDYTVAASTSRGAFEMTSGSNVVAYEVYFKGSIGTSGSYTQLPYNSSRSFSGASQHVSTDCNGGASLTSNLKIVVNEAALAAAAPGSYSSTLGITVAPGA